MIGSVGILPIAQSGEVRLHRLYVKADKKRQGIGTALLRTAEEMMQNKGKTAVYVHLGAPKEQWFESYAFYQKHGYLAYKPRFMKKELR